MLTIVPATAIRRDALGASVYVLEAVEENGRSVTRASKRKVQLAPAEGAPSDSVIIRAGIEAGEQIAAVGAFKLRDGALVAPSEADSSVSERLVGR